MIKKLLLLLFVFACTINYSCKKAAEGATSFTANINGVPFSTTNVMETSASGLYDFEATGAVNISLYLVTVSTGVYPLTTATPGMGCVSAGINYSSSQVSRRNTVSQGVISITGNTNSSITGTFNGILYAIGNPKDSIRVTAGQFTNLVYE